MTLPPEQFDARFRNDPRYGDHPALHRQRQRLETAQMEAQRARPDRPANIRWFEEAIEQGPPRDAELVGYLCQVVPLELIYAAGARPVRLDCGNAALAQRGEEVLTGEICPLVKAAYGAFLDREGRPNRCRAVLVPTTCDPKRKLGEHLADYLPAFMLNLPPEQDSVAYGAFMVREIKRMTAFLESVLGRRIKRRDIEDSIRASNRRSALARELMSACADRPEALAPADAHLIIQALHSGVDPEAWAARTKQVLDGIRDFPRDGRPRLRPRVIVTGAPMIWPNFKLLNLIEECEADLVADTLCSGFQSLVEPIPYDERGRDALLRALAARYVFASPCPCFISQGTRIRRVLDLVETCRAEGVIHYGLRLCQLFDMEVPRLGAALRERKIPFLSLRSDFSPEDIEQLRVRLEAFLETVGDTV